MATIKLGMLVTQIAGSIGGTTFRRGANFICMQNKTKGASKSKTLQNKALIQLGSISSQWSALSASEQSDWVDASLLFQFPDKFGDLKYLSGRQLFIKIANFTANVSEPIPDPNTLSSTVGTSTIFFGLIELNGPAFIELTESVPATLVVISAELIKFIGQAPTFTRREIILFDYPDVNLEIDINTAINTKFPTLAVGNIVRLYYYTQNSSGFKSLTQFFDINVTEPIIIVTGHMQIITNSTSSTWSPQTVVNLGSTLSWEFSGGITLAPITNNDPTVNLSTNIGNVIMDVYLVDEVTVFVCNNNYISEIILTELTDINTLDLSFNLLNSIDVSDNTSLFSLNLNTNFLSSINVDSNILLNTLAIRANLLSALDVSTLIDLESLQLNNNNITSLDIDSNTVLKFLEIHNNSIPSVDLSNNPLLQMVRVEGNNMVPAATDNIYIQLANHAINNGYLSTRDNRTTASNSARTALHHRGWTIVATSST